MAIVAVVGENMRGHSRRRGRTFAALGREGVNIIAIAQGSSEYNISLVIDAGATQHAVTTLHQEFRLGEAAPEATDSSRASAKSSEKVPARD